MYRKGYGPCYQSGFQTGCHPGRYCLAAEVIGENDHGSTCCADGFRYDFGVDLCIEVVKAFLRELVHFFDPVLTQAVRSSETVPSRIPSAVVPSCFATAAP